MKKNGYTIVELLVVILLLGVITAIAVNKISYAFDDNSKELVEQENKYILNAAKKYGETIKEDIKNKTSILIKVDDLIEKGYIIADDKDGNYYDPKDKSKTLNDTKIILGVNKNNDVTAKFEE